MHDTKLELNFSHPLTVAGGRLSVFL